MVRVRPHTHAALTTMLQEHEESAQLRGGRQYWRGDRPTMAELVEYLVSQEIAYRRRRAEYGQRRTAKRREARTESSGCPGWLVEEMAGAGEEDKPCP